MLMKKGIVYILGIITGVILTFVISFFFAGKGESKGVSYYDEPGEILSFRSVTTFQALSLGSALVRQTGHTNFNDQIYLLQLKEERALYDGETIKAPAGSVFRVIGVYSYETNGGMGRTVPVIAIMDRKEK